MSLTTTRLKKRIRRGIIGVDLITHKVRWRRLSKQEMSNSSMEKTRMKNNEASQKDSHLEGQLSSYQITFLFWIHLLIVFVRLFVFMICLAKWFCFFFIFGLWSAVVVMVWFCVKFEYLFFALKNEHRGRKIKCKT